MAASVLIHQPSPRTCLNPSGNSREPVLGGQSGAIGAPSTGHHVSRVLHGDRDASDQSLGIAARELPPAPPSGPAQRPQGPGPNRQGGSRGRGPGPGSGLASEPHSSFCCNVGARHCQWGRHEEEGRRVGGGVPSAGRGADAKALMLPQPPRQLVPRPHSAPLSSGVSLCLSGSRVNCVP